MDEQPDTSTSSPAARRRLAAVLAADIAGYSRLIGDDDVEAVSQLKGHQATVLPLIPKFNGRVIDTAGDGILAEFPSAFNAVQCAISIQSLMRERNESVRQDRQMQFRIGVNLGDVIYDEVRLYGDGVNIAARLEALAEPGGICISAKVYDEIRGRLPIQVSDIGEQRLKNISQPVHAYRVHRSGKNGSVSASKRSPIRVRKQLWLGVVIAAVIVLIGAVWSINKGMSTASRTLVTRESIAARPGIAIAPFKQIGQGAERDYFTDGLTEDLITDLSGVSALRVIARQSSFSMNSDLQDIKTAALELGVQYILLGTVRKSGSTLRVTASLVDVQDGRNVWADRYDHPVDDILALQDKITRQITRSLSVKLTADEESRFSRTAVINEDAYDTLLQGLLLLHRYSAADNDAAREKFKKAAAIDPYYARAYANIALTYAWDIAWYGEAGNSRVIALANDAAQKAEELDSTLPQIYFARGVLSIAQRRYQDAIDAVQRAIKLNTNYADAYALMAYAELLNGEAENSLNTIESAMLLNPKYPFSYLGIQGHALFLAGEFESALTTLSETLDRNPAYVPARVFILATRGHLGQLDEAAWDRDELLLLRPDYSLAIARTESLYRKEEDIELLIQGLAKAGLN